MNQRLTIHPFAIEAQDLHLGERAYYESIFSQGNGYMGVRGYAPAGIKENAHERSVFLAGFFEYIKPGITDMVNTPDIFSFRFLMDCQETSASACLDMKTGLLTRRCVYTCADGKMFHAVFTRLVSMQNVHAAALQAEITPLDENMSFILETGIDGDVANLPISDDQMAGKTAVHKLLQPVSCHADQKGGLLEMESVPSARRLWHAFRAGAGMPLLPEGITQKGYAAVRFSGTLKKGETVYIQKYIATYTCRDGMQDAADAAKQLAEELYKDGFAQTAEKSATAWALLWKDCDMELDAKGDLQGAVRYNIFQLLQNNASNDSRVSIGARGLMHGRYKGNYFWDTEIFMLPFFQYTRPEAARNLLMYRFHTLGDAVEGATRFGLSGARYSWMCSDTGFEQCETWDTGCCEVHITADVAYAIMQYVSITGDQAFLRDYGAEMLLQTARYWMTRLTYCNQDSLYHLLFVKGPDEYCGVTNNNTYTNWLVRENLNAAVWAAKMLKNSEPDTWARLQQFLSICEAELRTFEEAAQKIVILYDRERDLYLEDENFDRLEPFDISVNKTSYAALYRTMSYDRLQRYKVIKQADLVLLMTLYPKDFTHAQKENVWRYYEPLTLHDSTLSFGVHALLAAQLSKHREAMAYIEKSVYLDLKDVMENTSGEGIHIAALGATWQALVFGMAGLSVSKEGFPTLSPNLPPEIKELRFAIWVGGKRYRVSVNHYQSFAEPDV